jgi:hypothetical protein
MQILLGIPPFPYPHLRLVLETTPGAAYLTGEYVCEECGQQFHRPPVKQPSKKHKNALTPGLQRWPESHLKTRLRLLAKAMRQ